MSTVFGALGLVEMFVEMFDGVSEAQSTATPVDSLVLTKECFPGHAAE